MTKLDAEQVSALDRFVDSDNRIGYYDTLSRAGVEYGALAGGVVRGDTISGRMANTFLAERAAQMGVEIDSRQALAISLDLMRADYNARKAADWEEIGQEPIAKYHREVFEKHGLTRDAWTATAPLDVIARYYKQYGFSSPEEAKDALWSIMMREGFGANAYVYDEMIKFGSPQGLWLSFDGYPLDLEAAE